MVMIDDISHLLCADVFLLSLDEVSKEQSIQPKARCPSRKEDMRKDFQKIRMRTSYTTYYLARHTRYIASRSCLSSPQPKFVHD